MTDLNFPKLLTNNGSIETSDGGSFDLHGDTISYSPKNEDGYDAPLVVGTWNTDDLRAVLFPLKVDTSPKDEISDPTIALLESTSRILNLPVESLRNLSDAFQQRILTSSDSLALYEEMIEAVEKEKKINIDKERCSKLPSSDIDVIVAIFENIKCNAVSEGDFITASIIYGACTALIANQSST